MKTLTKLLPVLLVVIPLLAQVPAARADDLDIMSTNVQPNVMFLIDNSASMNDTINWLTYDPYTTYPQLQQPPYYQSAYVYNKVSGNYVLFATAVNLVNSATAQDALGTVGFWSGTISGSVVNLYLGNYLNFQGFSGAGSPTSKLNLVKYSLWASMYANSNARFGIATFTNNATAGSGGATILAKVGTPLYGGTTNIINALYYTNGGITAGGHTPLAQALNDIGTYFSSGLGYDGNSAIYCKCQANYVVVILNSVPDGTGDPDASVTAATNLYTGDHSSLSGIQNVIVDTIDFASVTSIQSTLDQILGRIATAGGGLAFAATNNPQFDMAGALNDITEQTQGAFATFATPVVPTTTATGLDRTYIAAAQSDPALSFWRGFLKAFNHDSKGSVKTDANGVPIEDSNCVLDNNKSCLAWEAGAQLNGINSASRTIKTVIQPYANGTTPPALQDFTLDNSYLTQDVMGGAPVFWPPQPPREWRDKTIPFVRGLDSEDQNFNGSTMDERDWKLGDILHSTPVVVSAPVLASTDTTFVSFRNARQSDRTTVVLAGSNDGMLHAFKETGGGQSSEDGKEVWAFIGPDLLPNLAALTKMNRRSLMASNIMTTVYGHSYFFDSSPIVADVRIGGQLGEDVNQAPNYGWHTIVVIGERRGGKYYHALDITDTLNPKYMWSFTDTEIAETWSEPMIGKIKLDDGSTRWVAFFGGGFDSSVNNAHGRAVYAVDVATGSLLWKDCIACSASGNADKQYMYFSIPASPLLLDLDNDGYIDRMYIGDVGGQLWRYDLSAPAHLSGGLINNWSASRVLNVLYDQKLPPNAGAYYAAAGIFITPAAALDGTGNLWILVGTGDRNNPLSIGMTYPLQAGGNSSSTSNWFYGFKEGKKTPDNFLRAVHLTRNSLVDVTSSGAIDPRDDNQAGWKFMFPSNKEKAIGGATVFNNIVYFSSYRVKDTEDGWDPCQGGGGYARLYAVYLTTGYSAIDWANNGTALSNNFNSSKSRSAIVGVGIPSRPVITIGDQGVITTTVLQGTTQQQLISSPAIPPPTLRRPLYWTER